MGRNTTTRDRHRAVIARGKPPCYLCGEDIDYDLPWPDPMCFTVDHIIPLDAGGEDILSNKAAAHWTHNRAKWKSTDGGPVIRRSGALKH